MGQFRMRDCPIFFMTSSEKVVRMFLNVINTLKFVNKTIKCYSQNPVNI